MSPILYIQADNSGKDNKSSFVIMFLAWLVKQKVFMKVKLGFLMVGHTHEDIDQIFSRISSHIRYRDAKSLPSSLTAIEGATTPGPEVLHLTKMHDYKKQMDKCRGLLKGMSGPHHFVIKKLEGRIVLKYKDWLRHEESYRTLDLSECIPDFGELEPVAVNPKFAGEVQRMKEDLVKWGEKCRLAEEEIKWWHEYLEREPTQPEISDAFGLPKFQITAAVRGESNDTLMSAINSAIEKHCKESNLKITRKRRRADT